MMDSVSMACFLHSATISTRQIFSMSNAFLALKQKRNGASQATSESRDASAQRLPVASSSQAVYSDLDERLFEICETPDAGRSLFAKKAVKAGTVLLQVDPHVAILDKAHLPLLCSGCMLDKPEITLKRCSICKAVFYCSEVRMYRKARRHF